MKRYVLTGTPGSGKTAIIRQLELDGFSVVEEAATDVIALQQACGVTEPWRHVAFLDLIAALQRQRQLRAEHLPGDIHFHDRSVICTAALARYLGFSISDTLRRELERVETGGIFERRVFFVRNLGFVAPTEARRISYQEALRFEQTHQDTYSEFGFEMVSIDPGTVAERAAAILRAIEQAGR